jgi:hypothetical protein
VVEVVEWTVGLQPNPEWGLIGDEVDELSSHNLSLLKEKEIDDIRMLPQSTQGPNDIIHIAIPLARPTLWFLAGVTPC